MPLSNLVDALNSGAPQPAQLRRMRQGSACIVTGSGRVPCPCLKQQGAARQTKQWALRRKRPWCVCTQHPNRLSQRRPRLSVEIHIQGPSGRTLGTAAGPIECGKQCQCPATSTLKQRPTRTCRPASPGSAGSSVAAQCPPALGCRTAPVTGGAATPPRCTPPAAQVQGFKTLPEDNVLRQAPPPLLLAVRHLQRRFRLFKPCLRMPYCVGRRHHSSSLCTSCSADLGFLNPA